MGENIPAVMAVVSLNNQIESYRFLHSEMKEKLVKIQEGKDLSQKNKGYVRPKLVSTIKNLTKTLLEDIAIESLSSCVNNKSLLVTEDLSRGFGRGSTKGTYVWMRQYTKLNDVLFDKSKELGLVNGKKQPINFSSDGILAKVPAGYTSKTSVQTGFILRSAIYMEFIDIDITGIGIIKLRDNLLDTTFELNLKDKSIMVDWNNMTTIMKFNGKASELGRYYDSELGNYKFNKLINTVFNETSKSSNERKDSIKYFIYNLLNPRKTQEVYTDIFTRKSVNSDVQGSINIARSYLFGQSKNYKSKLGSERLRRWQDWYKENLTEIPVSIYI